LRYGILDPLERLEKARRSIAGKNGNGTAGELANGVRGIGGDKDNI
jgi:hypothetical protein